MGTSLSSKSPQSMEQSMVITIAPHPLELSTKALYAASFTAFLSSILALSLAVSYIVCAFPLPMGVMKPLCEDDHYKYVLPLLIPTTVWFVIANWVGWEYFRNA